MKNQIDSELPVTTAGLRIYIEEVKKRIDFLTPYISEFRRLNNRLKVAVKKLEDRYETTGM